MLADSLPTMSLGPWHKKKIASRNPTDQPVWNITSHTDCGWKQIYCVPCRTSRFPQIIFFSNSTTLTKPLLVRAYRIRVFFTQVLQAVDCASHKTRGKCKQLISNLQKEKLLANMPQTDHKRAITPFANCSHLLSQNSVAKCEHIRENPWTYNVMDDSNLPRYCAASINSLLPKSRDKVSVPYTKSRCPSLDVLTQVCLHL